VKEKNIRGLIKKIKKKTFYFYSHSLLLKKNVAKQINEMTEF
jgi:hypothetical protein